MNTTTALFWLLLFGAALSGYLIWVTRRRKP